MLINIMFEAIFTIPPINCAIIGNFEFPHALIIPEHILYISIEVMLIK